MKIFGMILTAVGILIAMAGGSMLDSATLWIPLSVVVIGIGLAVPGVAILRKYEDEFNEWRKF